MHFNVCARKGTSTKEVGGRKDRAAKGYKSRLRTDSALDRQCELLELTCSADSLEIRTALHVVLTVIITVAGGISRIPFPTSPCTA